MEVPSSALRGAATDLLHEVVNKRMEPTAKIALVQQLGLANACERLSAGLVAAAAAGQHDGGAGGTPSTAAARGGGAGGGGASSADTVDEELLGKYAKLLATLASEVMDALKRVENGAALWLAAASLFCLPVCLPVFFMIPHLCLAGGHHPRNSFCKLEATSAATTAAAAVVTPPQPPLSHAHALFVCLQS
jgi:hypothetical protein